MVYGNIVLSSVKYFPYMREYVMFMVDTGEIAKR